VAILDVYAMSDRTHRIIEVPRFSPLGVRRILPRRMDLPLRIMVAGLRGNGATRSSPAMRGRDRGPRFRRSVRRYEIPMVRGRCRARTAYPYRLFRPPALLRGAGRYFAAGAARVGFGPCSDFEGALLSLERSERLAAEKYHDEAESARDDLAAPTELRPMGHPEGEEERNRRRIEAAGEKAAHSRRRADHASDGYLRVTDREYGDSEWMGRHQSFISHAHKLGRVKSS
jgi:hypothetical protein